MQVKKKSIKSNGSKKIIFNDLYSFSLGENNFFYYEDEYGGLKLPMPNLIGEFQLSNVATAIATISSLSANCRSTIFGFAGGCESVFSLNQLFKLSAMWGGGVSFAENSGITFSPAAAAFSAATIHALGFLYDKQKPSIPIGSP